jgi:CRISPR system Cascade subunit CasA
LTACYECAMSICNSDLHKEYISMPHCNLLTEPLLAVRVAGQDHPVRTTLPGLFAAATGNGPQLAALMDAQGAVGAPALESLMQLLAASALVAANKPMAAYDETAWRDMLRGLTPAFPDDEPWCLVVEDISKPAFLQPPAANWDDFKTDIAAPDDLTTLVTTKNHIVKQSRHDSTQDLAAWIAGLALIQGFSGRPGRGYHGIARMNGSQGSRALIEITTGEAFSQRYARNLGVMMDCLDEYFERYPHLKRVGKSLLWIYPWKTSLSAAELGPYFIEVTQRLRLTRTAQGLILARRATTECPRIEAKDFKGMIGDPWGVFDLKNGGVLTVPESGLDYARCVDLLFHHGRNGEKPRFAPSLLQILRPADEDAPDVFLSMRVLSGGQGKTGGWHSRMIRIPQHVRKSLRRTPETLAERAATMIALAADLRRKILQMALLILFQQGPEQVSESKKLEVKAADLWLARYEDAVDRDFFPFLWAQAEHADWDAAWKTRLEEFARDVLTAAIAEGPLNRDAGRYYRAVAKAENHFNSALHKLGWRTAPSDRDAA